MMNGMRGLAVVVLMGGLALSQGGCLIAAAAGAAGGTIAYVKGDLEGAVDGSVGQTVAAAKAAFEEMGMPVLSSYVAGSEGEVHARVGSDNKAKVKVTMLGEKSSKVNVRVGTFGDESLSREIYDKIKAKVAAPARAASL
jgi:hypothetical protein